MSDIENLGKIALSHVLTKVSLYIKEKKDFTIEWIDPATEFEHTLTHVSEEPQIFTDDLGRKWKRVFV
jgi:hypothetical protein